MRPDEVGDPASWGFSGRPPSQALSVIGRPGVGYDILLSAARARAEQEQTFWLTR